MQSKAKRREEEEAGLVFWAVVSVVSVLGELGEQQPIDAG